jgi:Mannosyltransferase putative
MKALRLALYMQEHSDFYYELFLGDKDTFKFSWKYLKIPYHMVKPMLAPIGNVKGEVFNGHSMGQFSPVVHENNATLLFIHANLLKYKSFGNEKVHSVDTDFPIRPTLPRNRTTTSKRNIR